MAFPPSVSSSQRGLPARILVATDFSPASKQAFCYAVALARQFRAQIFLTHIFTGVNDLGRAETSSPAYRAERQAAERAVAEILASTPLEGVPHEVLLEDGYLWQTLEKLIREKGIDFVAVGTHGGNVGPASMGSAAELIFRHADCPVLTAGPGIERECVPGFRHILFATDFGRAAQRAASCALSLAREFRANLTLLHVVAGQTCRSEETATLSEIAKVRLSELVPDALRQVCQVELAVAFGDPAKQVVEAARNKHVDLIVMGARTGRPLATQLPQAATYSVAVNAPCPVITVKA